MLPSLKKFNKSCNNLLSELNIFSEQVTAQINGKSLDVKENGDKIQINGEIDTTDQMANEQISQQLNNQYNIDLIENLISMLTSELDNAIKAARAARTYSKYNTDDLEKIKFNQGFAEGKKSIIKMILKQLTNMDITENEPK